MRSAGWTAALATQVAAAWLLSCVFVRTLEDRGLLRQARIAGPGAIDSQRLFFQLAPSLTERDYLLMVWKELAQYPAARGLFDAEQPRTLANKVIEYWYTGMYDSGGQAAVATYTDALAWQAITWATAPSNSQGAMGFWAEPPKQRG